MVPCQRCPNSVRARAESPIGLSAIVLFSLHNASHEGPRDFNYLGAASSRDLTLSASGHRGGGGILTFVTLCFFFGVPLMGCRPETGNSLGQTFVSVITLRQAWEVSHREGKGGIGNMTVPG